MSKLWSWLKPRGGRGQRVAEARAGMERARRTLLAYSPGLEGKLLDQVREAERLGSEARAADERGDDATADQAVRSYEQASTLLSAVRREVAAEHPELVVREFLARAEETLDQMEDEIEKSEASLQLFSTYVEAKEADGARKLL